MQQAKGMHDLQKALVWLFLLATVATAGLNSVKLTKLLWQAWQQDSSQSDEFGLPKVGSSSIALR